MLTRKLLLLTLTTTMLFAEYINCEFQKPHYEEICKKVVKKGVPVHDANLFLLSRKTEKMDLRSFKLFHPDKIQKHRENEKKANNVLVKYVPKIIAHVKKYDKVYDEAEKRYGVNREIVASILMKETKLGIIKPSFDAFEVFNTLVVKVKVKTKRDKWLLNMGKSNLVSIISYCYKKGYAPEQCSLPSSYAGAVGIPQFMPSSFVYIDSYKDKVGDLTKMEDAIMSASRYLHKKANFTTLIDWSKIPKMPKVEADWYDYEFKNKDASFVYSQSKKTGKKYNCFACNKPELEYLRTYAKTIMRYNNSSNYAIGVMRLAYDTHKGL
ncbi:MAG: membrane-bound lytic murein transglycosylase B [Sulfurimonas sp.]|jgi:membrane-bound lytic murein transglycosylase B|uniref:lytic murein transglycosylase n=1 Tax=Sulfurimonas sp. TaxID=2022749 RepID=UPI0039E5662C